MVVYKTGGSPSIREFDSEEPTEDEEDESLGEVLTWPDDQPN